VKKPTISIEPVFVIVADVSPPARLALSGGAAPKFATKSFNGQWCWRQTWSDAERFVDEHTAKKRLRYLLKTERDNSLVKNIRLYRITLHPQIELLIPTPGIVDAVGALDVPTLVAV
jgi:hypothetical protein